MAPSLPPHSSAVSASQVGGGIRIKHKQSQSKRRKGTGGQAGAFKPVEGREGREEGRERRWQWKHLALRLSVLLVVVAAEQQTGQRRGEESVFRQVSQGREGRGGAATATAAAQASLSQARRGAALRGPGRSRRPGKRRRRVGHCSYFTHGRVGSELYFRQARRRIGGIASGRRDRRDRSDRWGGRVGG